MDHVTRELELLADIHKAYNIIARVILFKVMVIITPRACARGKVIGCVVVVVSTKIAISRDVGI